MHVHSTHAFEREDRLRADLVPEITLSLGGEAPANTRVLVDGRPTEARLDLPGLEGVIIPWSGVWPAVRDRLRDRPHLRVHNLHHNAAIVAEHAIGLLLAASRRLIPMHRRFSEGDWTPRYAPDPSPLLAGSTALILGYGAIGRGIARRVHALGMRVHAINRSGHGPGPAEVHPLSDLDALLPEATAVLIALPHTDATHHLLDARRLSLCRRDAILVNIARASLCEEAALYDALDRGRLFGAGLDVWWRYPANEAERPNTPPSTLPFHQLDNVVLSPHRAGHAVQTESLRMRDLAISLNAWARGDVVPHAVDLARGY